MREYVEIAECGEVCDCGGQIRHNNGGNYHVGKTLRYNFCSQCFEIVEWSSSDFEEDDVYVFAGDVDALIRHWYDDVRQSDGMYFNFDEIEFEKVKSIDWEKVRRRVRDALNKSNNQGAIASAALAFDVKILD